MNHQVTFSYLACQTCQAKIHCDRCGEEVAGSLMNMDGVERVEMNMKAKSLVVSGDVDVDDLEIKLEDLGLLVD